MIHFQPLYSLAGVFVGLLVGMTGVGGGSLMTPLLVLAFGFHPATAVGTDLLYASGTKVVGTGVHGSKGTVDWTITRRLATGSLPATLLTLWAIHAADARTEAVNDTITVALGVALVLTGIATFFRAAIVARLGQRFAGLSTPRVAWATIALGVMLGVLVTLTSVGAGALGMTALLILYPRAPVARLVGSDIAHAVPLTLLAGLGHASMGTVDAGLLVSLLVGSVPGIVIGSLVAAKVSERVLVPVLAVTLVVVGARLLM